MTVENQNEPVTEAQTVPAAEQGGSVVAPAPQESLQVSPAAGKPAQTVTQPEKKTEPLIQPAVAEAKPAEQAKPQMTASGKRIIRASAASQGAVAEHSPEMSRPQGSVTPQPFLEEDNGQKPQKDNSWMSALNRMMFITAILIAGGATFALWALGTALSIKDLVDFITGIGWLILPPLLFVGVMALLLYLEMEKGRKQATGVFEPKEQSKPFHQTKRESDQEHMPHVQESSQHSERGKQESARSVQLSVQPAQRKSETKAQERVKAAPAPQPVAVHEPEDQLPKPPPEIVFTTQSTNALPISRDGGAFFPQSSTKIPTLPHGDEN